MKGIKKIIIVSLATTGSLFITGKSIAETIPRIGVNFGNYYLEEYIGGDTADEMVVGPTAGILWTIDENFFDLSTETYSFSTDSGADVDRSEIAGTYGFLLRETMYGLIGYQYAMFGDGLYDSEVGESYGPFFGISVNNLRMGQDSKNVFSIALAVQFQETEYAGLTDSDESLNLKIGYRRAGDSNSYSLKYQTFGSDFHAEWIWMLNYSYQFTAF